ncbi:unnamed protein product [Didymodactylos carnosus]|uniref:Uncharacterized protein n=1 Tax=Didymodactylos carnosus TaxID=1234261 RepID=A0A814JRK9_9BILA|nr:unnamed protein product [Didymodactylos carnosus]CAF1042783.1 unnamed protein product [Didymodactylos carnosus]CAF3685557.1 unnamed protein product [Didymodactylos carnosus]CAF3812918.1 unnamed protein product [Didymodactylos carnosus]
MNYLENDVYSNVKVEWVDVSPRERERILSLNSKHQQKQKKIKPVESPVSNVFHLSQDAMAARVFSIVQTTTNYAQRPLRIGSSKCSLTAASDKSKKENFDAAMKELSGFLDQAEQVQTQDYTILPAAKRLRSSPSNAMEQSQSTIARFSSHDSYLKPFPPASPPQSSLLLISPNDDDNSFFQDACLSDWNTPPSNRKMTSTITTPTTVVCEIGNKNRTMSSSVATFPMYRKSTVTETITTIQDPTETIIEQEKQIPSTTTITSTIDWGDDGADDWLSQIPMESLVSESLKPKTTLPVDDILKVVYDDSLLNENATQNNTRILQNKEVFKTFINSDNNLNDTIPTLQSPKDVVPLSPLPTVTLKTAAAIHRTITDPLPTHCYRLQQQQQQSNELKRTRCDSVPQPSNNVVVVKRQCTPEEIEQKRRAALEKRKQASLVQVKQR